MQHTRDMDENENLYETRAGMTKLATVLSRIWDDVQSERKKNSGHLSSKLASPITGKPTRPNDVKRAALEALEQCEFRLIAPPAELVALFHKLLGTSDDHRRDKVRFPKAKAARIKAETGYKGRKLARELRRRGFSVSDRSVARHEKDFAPQKI